MYTDWILWYSSNSIYIWTIYYRILLITEKVFIKKNSKQYSDDYCLQYTSVFGSIWFHTIYCHLLFSVIDIIWLFPPFTDEYWFQYLEVFSSFFTVLAHIYISVFTALLTYNNMCRSIVTDKQSRVSTECYVWSFLCHLSL